MLCHDNDGFQYLTLPSTSSHRLHWLRTKSHGNQRHMRCAVESYFSELMGMEFLSSDWQCFSGVSFKKCLSSNRHNAACCSHNSREEEICPWWVSQVLPPGPCSPELTNSSTDSWSIPSPVSTLNLTLLVFYSSLAFQQIFLFWPGTVSVACIQVTPAWL